MTHRIRKGFDFDTPVDRRNTGSIKWDKYQGKDIIPLWVADMDFKSPPAVIASLKRRIELGIFGYSRPPDSLVDQVVSMLGQVHEWKVDPEWIVWLPGLVTGINVACRAVGHANDCIMTTVPAYPPFLSAPALAGRTLATVAHVQEDGRYAFDFNGIEKSFTKGTGLFLLCNPQNPTGRVFTRDELSRLADICLSRKAFICSDEIHCGLVLDPERRHISIAAMDEEIGKQTITLLAPSKAYNLPGLGCSLAVIPEKGLRSRFRKVMEGIVPHVNVLGLVAAMAAYSECEEWRLALLDYLRGNSILVEDFVSRTQGLSMCPVEATYLAWIDCRGLGIQEPGAFFENHGVGLSNGKDFGMPGFVRLNFGCPRSLLHEALDRMKKAVMRFSAV